MDLRQVTLNVATACNLRCIYCAVGGCRSTEVMTDVPGELARRRDEGYGVVVFSGGEPTLQPELPAWVARARELGFVQRTIVTNGLRLGARAYVEELVEAGLTHVNVSFHTCREEAFDRLAARPGAFRLARRGIETVVEVARAMEGEARLFVHANLLLMRPTAADAADTVRFLAELGVPIITIEVLRQRGLAVVHAAELVPDIESVLDAVGACAVVAARTGVRLSTLDVPSCLTAESHGVEAVDVPGFLTRREKAVHWVVSGSSEGALNRATHTKGPFCERCGVTPWCSGIERTLLDDGPAIRVGGRTPRRIDPRTMLVAARRAVREAPGLAERALGTCALFAPPSRDLLGDWLALYAAYAETLLPFDPDANAAAAAALGIFPPPRRSEPAGKPAALTRALARGEGLLEQRLSSLDEALRGLPLELPACCAEATGAAPADLLRYGPWSLLPNLLPFGPCRPDCDAARREAARRLELLPGEQRSVATRLLESAVLVLGPRAKVIFRGRAIGPRALRYGRGAVLLTDPKLPETQREALRTAFARLVLPHLLAGDVIEEDDFGVTIGKLAGEGPESAARVARIERKLRWAPSLHLPDRLRDDSPIEPAGAERARKGSS